MNKFVLLLTATITPQSVPHLKRSDPKQREKDYFDAIQQWLPFNIPIVFCENSDTKSALIVELLEKSTIPYEYLTFNSQFSHKGKSHGEAEIMSHALNNSTLIAASENVIKLTGRYFVANFQDQINGIHNNDRKSIIYANIHDYLRYGDSRFFIGSLFFWKTYLSEKIKLIDEPNGIYMEHVLARSIHAAMSDGFDWQLLPEFPIYKGIYGTQNTEYTNDLLPKIRDKYLYRLKKKLIKKVLI